MNSYRLASLLAIAGLLLFSSVAFAEEKEKAQSAPDSKAALTDKSADTDKSKTPSANKIIIYYFHGDMRCANCIKFENWTAETLKTSFAEQMKDGSVEWRIVNTDQKDNQHFMKDYQLFTKSVVLVQMKNGKQVKFKNLANIWQLLNSQKAFMEYIKTEISAMANAK
ncbi:MAG: nitrophenyl compound nitroreductase subunit ArsF family protein [bacterium]|nr:nitrophenyl compound nitroreductase subunit ArsF family protein [Candidatus Sumerlaeota bacterium]